MDREHMQEVINGMRKIVKPYLAKQLKKINFEGCGNTDKAEFETDFEIVLTLAEKALAIPSADPYKGMTNGEVIKTVFPKAVLHTEYDDVYLSFQQGVYLQDKDTTWLNAPYKVEPEDQNNG